MVFSRNRNGKLKQTIPVHLAAIYLSRCSRQAAQKMHVSSARSEPFRPFRTRRIPEIFHPSWKMGIAHPTTVTLWFIIINFYQTRRNLRFRRGWFTGDVPKLELSSECEAHGPVGVSHFTPVLEHCGTIVRVRSAWRGRKRSASFRMRNFFRLQQGRSDTIHPDCFPDAERLDSVFVPAGGTRSGAVIVL